MDSIVEDTAVFDEPRIEYVDIECQCEDCCNKATGTATTYTDNGAPSNESTGSYCLDYFFKCRGASSAEVGDLVVKAWKENPLTTLKLMFYTRDCRGGKGERKLFYDSFLAIYRTSCDEEVNAYNALNINIKHIPEYGSWKDVFHLWEVLAETNMLGGQILRLITAQLETDFMNMGLGKPVSLCAKWAPSANSKLGITLAKQIYRSRDASKIYRTKYLTPLREYINIVERLMCAGKWEDIEFSKVPSQAMRKLKNAFKKHTPEKFGAWLEEVKAGKSKVCAKQLFPYQLVSNYGAEDPLVEEQWKVISNSVSASLKDTVIVVDTSGSMTSPLYKSATTCMDVALSLGLLVAEHTQPPFRNTIITFTTDPTLLELPDPSISMHTRLERLRLAPWGGSTNIQAVFDLIINKVLEVGSGASAPTPIPAPKRVIIVSDMQFNAACRDINNNSDIIDNIDSSNTTNFEVIKQKYAANNLIMPQLVFWNVAGDTKDFPIKMDDANTILISGFSQSILESIIDGNTSPMDIMNRVINNPRYDKITLN